MISDTLGILKDFFCELKIIKSKYNLDIGTTKIIIMI